jgi:hypothetical protein
MLAAIAAIWASVWVRAFLAPRDQPIDRPPLDLVGRPRSLISGSLSRAGHPIGLRRAGEENRSHEASRSTPAATRVSGGRAAFSGSTWVHDAVHRGGVAYADPGTRARFDVIQPGSAVASVRRLPPSGRAISSGTAA